MICFSLEDIAILLSFILVIHSIFSNFWQNYLYLFYYSYTLPTFIKGFRKDLEVSDLYETFTDHKSDRLGNKLEAAWKEEELNGVKNKRKPSLRRALFKAFTFEFMIYGFVLAFNELAIK